MRREELIDLLGSRGLIATPRDWAMGETVLVSHERLKSVHEGIEVYAEAAYVRLDPDGWWTMTAPQFVGDEMRYATLSEVLDELERRFLRDR